MVGGARNPRMTISAAIRRPLLSLLLRRCRVWNLFAQQTPNKVLRSSPPRFRGEKANSNCRNWTRRILTRSRPCRKYARPRAAAYDEPYGSPSDLRPRMGPIGVLVTLPQTTPRRSVTMRLAGTVRPAIVAAAMIRGAEAAADFVGPSGAARRLASGCEPNISCGGPKE